MQTFLSRIPRGNFVRLGLLVAALAASLPAAGVYRYTDADGNVVYTDRPPAGRPDADRVRIAPPPPVQPPRSVPTPDWQPSPAQRARDERINERITLREELRRELLQAQEHLEQAREALEAGRVPRPGGRVGGVMVPSRLRKAYFDRVRALERSVTDAKRQADRAARNYRLMRPEN
ncbi:MAG: DUF4124 domain-containing protein [Gammaproteobacteria bacterium]